MTARSCRRVWITHGLKEAGDKWVRRRGLSLARGEGRKDRGSVTIRAGWSECRALFLGPWLRSRLSHGTRVTSRACPCEITRLVPPGTGNETCPALTLLPFSRLNTGQLSIPVCATSTVPSRVHYAKGRDRPEQTSNPLRRQNRRCPMRVPAAAAVAAPSTAPSGALRGWRGQSCPQGRRRRAEPRLRCFTRPGNSRTPRTPKEQRPR